MTPLFLTRNPGFNCNSKVPLSVKKYIPNLHCRSRQYTSLSAVNKRGGPHYHYPIARGHLGATSLFKDRFMSQITIASLWSPFNIVIIFLSLSLEEVTRLSLFLSNEGGRDLTKFCLIIHSSFILFLTSSLIFVLVLFIPFMILWYQNTLTQILTV